MMSTVNCHDSPLEFEWFLPQEDRPPEDLQRAFQEVGDDYHVEEIREMIREVAGTSTAAGVALQDILDVLHP